MAAGSPSPVRRVLMGWLTLSFVLAWLPLLRAFMDGTSYQWGARYFGVQFSGAGLTGDLWLLVAQTALGVWLLHRGWRHPAAPFPAVLLAWLGFAAADSVYARVAEGGLHFEGATLGVSLSPGTVLPLLHVGFFCLALAWVARGGEGAAARPAWHAANTALLGVVALLFPVQFLLLRAGQGQEAKDVIGVLLTISQWILLSAALYPWRPRQAARAAPGPAVRSPA